MNLLKRPHSLAARLSITYSVTFVVMLALSFAALFVGVRAVIDARVDEDLEEDVEELSQAFQRGGEAAVIDEMMREMSSGDTEEVFLMLLDTSGRVLHASDLEHFSGARVPADAVEELFAAGDGRFATERYPDRESLARTLLAPIAPGYAVYLAESFEPRDEIMELLLIAFASVFLLALPFAGGLTWWLARRASQGVVEVGRAASAIRDGDGDARVRSAGHSAEVVELAEAFNAMADRNQQLLADMRDMTDNIAHDLRSPLTRVRIVAEDLMQGVAKPVAAARTIIDECDRLTRLIDLALDVSEAEAGVVRRPRPPLDIAALVEGVAELYAPLAEERGIEMRLGEGAAARVAGERPALERTVANLIDNAVKYTPPGGRIDVSVTRADGQVDVVVLDSGIGVPPDARDRVFDRYFRVDDSRSGAGSGLGLAYARAVARSHGGEIELDVGTEGGSRFRLRLPELSDDIVRRDVRVRPRDRQAVAA